MLGYRDINGTISTDTAAQELINFLEMNKFIFDAQNDRKNANHYENNEQFNLYEFYDIKYAFISDSLILTYYPLSVNTLTDTDKMYMHSANALFIIMMRLQTFIFNCFSEKGVFLRGGISDKFCYIKDTFAVGEGLIEAYKIESTIANHPRIAFSSSIISNNKLMEKVKFISDTMYNGNQIISVDPKDGVSFLDYIGFNLSTIDTSNKKIQHLVLNHRAWFDELLKTVTTYIEKHSIAIQVKLEHFNSMYSTVSDSDRNGIGRVIEKFEWLQSYHNERVRKNNLLSHLIVK